MITYGFYEKKNFYTVWEVTVSYEPIDNNRQYKVYNYKYIKHIFLEPATLDEAVNGHARSFTKKEVEYTNLNTFRFGRYAGQNIKEVNDIKYTRWYFKQVTGDHKQYVREFLYDSYCEFRVDNEGNEYAITKEQYNKELQRKQKANYMLERTENGEQVYLEIKRNPNERGEIFINGVTYVFPKVVERYYKGYVYYVPVKNGHAKRIKNKTILAKLFPLDNKLYIGNFKIA